MVRIKNPTFVGIGVGQGDAFFLDKAGVTILVDGGRSAQGFPVHFQRATGRKGVDIVVCTHNDADHALGVLGFLQSGLACNEVWLPASWTDRLEDLLLHPEQFADELVQNIWQEAETIRERPSLQALGDRYAERLVQQEGEPEGTDTVNLDALSEALEEASEMEPYGHVFGLYSPPGPPEDWPQWWWEFPRMLRRIQLQGFRLFLEALSAATLIRDIALAAYHMGARIRWFAYDSTSNGGGEQKCLVPVNAREVWRMRVRRWSALECLALTRSNKQSLVCLSPANEAPAVLFTADSDLAFPQPIRWSEGMILTAPHHGAEANAKAYQRFARETGGGLDVIWVRSDGRFRARPSRSYLNAPGDRFCTWCRGSNYPKQDVRLVLTSGRWRPVSTRTCCCV